VSRLPDGLREAADFSATPQSLPLDTTAYVAPAGAARYPAPDAQVSRSGDIVTLDLKTEGEMVMLVAPPQAGLQSVTVAGVFTEVAGGQAIIACSTPDCAQARVSLRLSSSEPLELLLVSQKRGLPSDGTRLLKARGAEAVPQQQGDRTMLVGRIQIPGR
jgi:hypothetical protein